MLALLSCLSWHTPWAPWPLLSVSHMRKVLESGPHRHQRPPSPGLVRANHSADLRLAQTAVFASIRPVQSRSSPAPVVSLLPRPITFHKGSLAVTSSTAAADMLLL